MTQSWLPRYFNQVLHVELQDVGLYAVFPCLIRQAVADQTAVHIRLGHAMHTDRYRSERRYITSVVVGNGWAAAIEHFIVTKRLTPLAARKLSQVVAFASPSACIGVLLALGDTITPLVAAALFSAALGMNMASHSGAWHACMIVLLAGLHMVPRGFRSWCRYIHSFLLLCRLLGKYH